MYLSKKLYVITHRPIGNPNNIPPIKIPKIKWETENISDAIKDFNPKIELKRNRNPVNKPGDTFLSLMV